MGGQGGGHRLLAVAHREECGRRWSEGQGSSGKKKGNSLDLEELSRWREKQTDAGYFAPLPRKKKKKREKRATQDVRATGSGVGKLEGRQV